ncbi:hypothetical protein BDZ89DRAFT_1075876, partial [Hymenopellis radicata]
QVEQRHPSCQRAELAKGTERDVIAWTTGRLHHASPSKPQNIQKVMRHWRAVYVYLSAFKFKSSVPSLQPAVKRTMQQRRLPEGSLPMYENIVTMSA